MIKNRITDAKAKGLDQNTLIVFASDNEGAEYTRSTGNVPFKGGKATMYEGGVRVSQVYYLHPGTGTASWSSTTLAYLYEHKNLSKQFPEVTQAMLKEAQDWLKKNVKPHYMPVLNPDYDAVKDKRPYPFRDLRKR
ncbi:MAG: hypothetical protein ACYTGH_20925 [Planctomycetota bacterium]|jgi:hypothetical protein